MLTVMSKFVSAAPSLSAIANPPFRVIEFARADPPAGQPESEWYRYVISQGREPMSGLRQGTRGSVAAAVDEIVLRMNERRLGRFGRVHLRMGDRPKSDPGQR